MHRSKPTVSDRKQRKPRKRRHNGFSNTDGGILASLQPVLSTKTNIMNVPVSSKTVQEASLQKHNSGSDAGGESSPSAAIRRRRKNKLLRNNVKRTSDHHDNGNLKSQPPSNVLVNKLASTTNKIVSDEYKYDDNNNDNNNNKNNSDDESNESDDEDSVDISDISSLSPSSKKKKKSDKLLSSSSFQKQLTLFSPNNTLNDGEEESLRPRPLFQDDDLSSYSADEEVSIGKLTDDDDILINEEDDDEESINDEESIDDDAESEESEAEEEESDTDDEESEVVDYDVEDEKVVVTIVRPNGKDDVVDEDYSPQESTSDTDEELQVDSDSSITDEDSYSNIAKKKKSSAKAIILDDDGSEDDTEEELEVDDDDLSISEAKSLRDENSSATKNVVGEHKRSALINVDDDEASKDDVIEIHDDGPNFSEETCPKIDEEENTSKTDDFVDNCLVKVLDDVHLDDDDDDDNDVLVATIIDDDDESQDKDLTTSSLPKDSNVRHNKLLPFEKHQNGDEPERKSISKPFLSVEGSALDSTSSAIEQTPEKKNTTNTKEEELPQNHTHNSNKPPESKENTHQHQPKKQVKFRREGSVQRGQWSLGSKIGTGSFGVVHVGMNKQTGTLMAVKSVQIEKAVIKDARREIELLRSLKHVNIVRYLGAEMDATSLHIFQEWVPGGSVTSLLQKFGPFSMPVLRSYLLQIMSGLAYLHDNRVLHRDIKGGNVLVNDIGVVKLADFGASKKIAQRQQLDMECLTVRGTPYFMAPEVFEEKYGTKADIWSVGCVAFQMATSQPPWKGMGLTNQMSLFMHLKSTEGPPTLTLPQTTTQDASETTALKSLLQKCFSRNPSVRPSANSLMKETFLTDFDEPEDDHSQNSRGLFSPGADWESLMSPQRPGTNKVAFLSPEIGNQKQTKGSFLSPPFLPASIRKKAYNAMPSPAVSSLTGNSSLNIDPNDWPEWAKKEYQAQSSNNNHAGGFEGSKIQNSSNASLSLAVSSDSNSNDARINPFGRTSGSSSLQGLQFAGSLSR